jgi:hypothetical protein
MTDKSDAVTAKSSADSPSFSPSIISDSAMLKEVSESPSPPASAFPRNKTNDRVTSRCKGINAKSKMIAMWIIVLTNQLGASLTDLDTQRSHPSGS